MTPTAIVTTTSPRYLPRKGTETSDIYAAYLAAQELRHDIYPARGRKLQPTMNVRHRTQVFATIFTPQGDGNEG